MFNRLPAYVKEIQNIVNKLKDNLTSPLLLCKWVSGIEYKWIRRINYYLNLIVNTFTLSVAYI